MTRKHICPSCGENAGVNIRYGYPSTEMMEARERGEIALDGCVISDNDPERRCLKCGHEWHIRRRPQPMYNAIKIYKESKASRD